jgi:hypothetical protein
MRPFACWECEFEPHRRQGCLSLLSVVCCQVGVFNLGWSLVQRSPLERGVSECDRKTSLQNYLKENDCRLSYLHNTLTSTGPKLLSLTVTKLWVKRAWFDRRQRKGLFFISETSTTVWTQSTVYPIFRGLYPWGKVAGVSKCPLQLLKRMNFNV